MPQVHALLAILLAFYISDINIFAQTSRADSSKSPVHVRSINFDPAKIGGQQNPWIRAQVELGANYNPATKAGAEQDAASKKFINKQWVDKIKVTLTLIFKPLGAATATDFVYYRSTATVLTMEVNTNRSVFFYLPGDIVKRDRLKMQPDYYYVQIELGGTEVPIFNEAGRPVPDMQSAVHKVLFDKKSFDNARSEADRAVNNNIGMLRPQYLVPSSIFDNFPQGSPSPEYIREDTNSR